MSPPTWKQLDTRAKKLSVTIERNRHEARLEDHDSAERMFVSSWVSRKADSVILRAAVDAALRQMESA